MVAQNALPPHPRAAGSRWAEIWRERLEGSEPYLLKWLAHPVEDDYWMQGSIRGSYERIQAASFLIGGWHDGYVNPPLRTFRALTAPKRLLMGPWSHTYPDRSHCGPRIDIYHELLRWWDRWLKGIENGVEREPRVIVYVPEFERPDPDRRHIAGSWCAADDLPGDAERTWHLGAGTLADAPASAAGVDRFRYLPGSARNGGVWDAGIPFCLPGDQRPDEAFALNYTSEPLTEDRVLLGPPIIEMTVSADVPVLPFAVRLSEVGEDGTSVLVTKGILNVTRRGGMGAPEPLAPDTPTPIRFDLEATAWRFRRGHRLRLTIDGSDFPNVWPTPFAGTGAIHRGIGVARLRLPIWHEPAASPVAFLPSQTDPPRPAPAATRRPGGWSTTCWRIVSISFWPAATSSSFPTATRHSPMHAADRSAPPPGKASRRAAKRAPSSPATPPASTWPSA
jgi:putative CocE/NonD family hydrolase